MKSAIVFPAVIIILFFSSSVFAQYPQMDFPLQVGNRWQYTEFPGYYCESQALIDTLMPNGLIYTQVQGDLFHGFFRNGSGKVFIYDSSMNDESTYYDFTHTVGDTLSLYINNGDTTITIVYEEGTYIMFGQQRHYMSFFTKSSSSSAYAIEEVTDGLGFTSFHGEVLSFGLSGAIINGIQYGTILDVEDGEINRPRRFELLQNYPNPFNPVTTICFNLSKNGEVQLVVYNILGRKIAILLNKKMPPGRHAVEWNASNYGSGLYFYRLTAGELSEVRKMLLVK
jgi:hypothetical protein